MIYLPSQNHWTKPFIRELFLLIFPPRKLYILIKAMFKWDNRIFKIGSDNELFKTAGDHGKNKSGLADVKLEGLEMAVKAFHKRYFHF